MQRCTHLVDLEKCCKMSIYLQRSASIQKRTSPPKFGVKNAQLVVGSLLKERLVRAALRGRVGERVARVHRAARIERAGNRARFLSESLSDR